MSNELMCILAVLVVVVVGVEVQIVRLEQRIKKLEGEKK